MACAWGFLALVLALPLIDAYAIFVTYNNGTWREIYTRSLSLYSADSQCSMPHRPGVLTLALFREPMRALSDMRDLTHMPPKNNMEFPHSDRSQGSHPASGAADSI